MDEILVDRIKNHNIDIVAETLTNGTTEKFIVSFYNYITEFIAKENKISKGEITICNSYYSNRTKIFLEWFDTCGKIFFEDILVCLKEDKLNENVESFSKLYNYLFEKSIAESNLEALIDYLYLVPKVMKREYEKFGFIIEQKNYESNKVSIENQNVKLDYVFKKMNYFEGSENQIPCFI